ncbi:hypothetical protein [Shimia sagamensis]|uniref:Uncharacterized protein n=1 Tax=Shimia sagamensis TaxID=1566352 RepID=A0ABY1N9Q8_9RHOB|nr:hypothetical protein [Shimia sagamensis]SMP04230.1 hypothetical protein SAMN06265373_101425 [Shimia sagamensis]
MSYDLLVFDPQVAPVSRPNFMAWYGDLTKWEETRDYNSPEGMTGTLPQFYNVLRREFPPMNGPHAFDFDTLVEEKRGFWQRLFGGAQALEPFNESLVTDYSFAQSGLYLSFAWSVAEQAYDQVVRSALETGVGFFDVSATDGVIAHTPEQLRALVP